jgi:hypothetical protein
MSILKSTVAGKNNVPITLEWLLANGWDFRMKKDPGALEPKLDKTKIYCDGHFLSIDNVVDAECCKRIVWTYKTNAAIYKFYIKTFADYDKIVEYYKEYRPKERAKLKNRILQQPEIEKASLLWFSGTDIKQTEIKKSNISFHEVDMF